MKFHLSCHLLLFLLAYMQNSLVINDPDHTGSACVCWSKISICSLVVLFCNLLYNIACILSGENHVDVPMNVGLSTSHGEGYENLCMSILQMDLL
jgi:hypothetical protein